MHSPSHRAQSYSMDNTGSSCLLNSTPPHSQQVHFLRLYLPHSKSKHSKQHVLSHFRCLYLCTSCLLFWECSFLLLLHFLQMKFKLCLNPPPCPAPSVFEKTSLRGLLYTYFPKSLIFLSSGLFLYPVHFYFCFSFSVLQLLTSVSFLSESEFPQARTKLPPLHPLSI